MTADPAEGTGSTGPVVLHGVDVVAIERIEDLLAEFPTTFPDRICTLAEQHYCDDRGFPAQHYAARWAATEAVCKLLDDAAPPLAATDVEIDRRSDGPRLVLEPAATRAIEGTLQRRAETAGGVSNEASTGASDAASPVAWDAGVSLSHDREAGVALASVTVAAVAAGAEQ